jgi:hypothetical protein
MTRRYLTANDMRNMLRRQLGLCANPACVSEGPFEADHSTPHAWDDKKPDQLLCIPCHRAKTKLDVKAIAKAKRLNGTTSSQWSRREKAGGSRIRGKGFQGWRRFDGSIVVK